VEGTESSDLDVVDDSDGVERERRTSAVIRANTSTCERSIGGTVRERFHREHSNPMTSSSARVEGVEKQMRSSDNNGSSTERGKSKKRQTGGTWKKDEVLALLEGARQYKGSSTPWADILKGDSRGRFKKGRIGPDLRCKLKQLMKKSDELKEEFKDLITDA
jgi:hypothetical protein